MSVAEARFPWPDFPSVTISSPSPPSMCRSSGNGNQLPTSFLDGGVKHQIMAFLAVLDLTILTLNLGRPLSLLRVFFRQFHRGRCGGVTEDNIVENP